MAFTTFAAVTQISTPQFDANFQAVMAGGGAFLCTVSGTNALALTVTANAPIITALTSGMVFFGIVANTNTTSGTAAIGAFTARTIYKDSLTGPVLLVGGELVQNNAFWLSYDSTLAAGAGGFHLLGSSGAVLTGQSLVLGGLSFSQTPSTILKRLVRVQRTIVFTSVAANTMQDQTQTLTGLFSGDTILANPNAVAPVSGIQYSGFVPADGTLGLRAANITTGAVTPNSVFNITTFGGFS